MRLPTIKALLSGLVLAAAAAYALAQADAIKLKPENEIRKEIVGTETHRYKFKLRPQEFTQLRVEQMGADVALKLVDSRGVTLAVMDSPNSDQGPETLSFIAPNAGVYMIEVRGLNPASEKGEYSIKRTAGRTANQNDRLRVAVEQLFVEGMAARETTGQLDTAITKFEQALTGWRGLNDAYLADLTSQQVVQLKRAKANATYDQGYALIGEGTAEAYQTALQLFTNATELYSEIDDKSEKAGLSLFAAGLLHSNLGDKRRALRVYSQALEFFEQNNFPIWQATTLNNIGRNYDDIGDKKSALANYDRALPMFRQLSDKRGEGNTLNNLGLLYESLSENQKALDHYNLALGLFLAISEKNGEANTLGNIGSVLDEMGESQKATEYYSRALKLYTETADRAGEAITLNNLGTLYNELDETPKAIDHYIRALALFRIVGDRGGEADTLNNLGAAYNDLNDLKKALGFYEQALPIYQEVEDANGRATVLNNIGSLYNGRGERERAIDLFKQAVVIYREIGSKSGEAASLNNLAGAYDGLGRKADALNYFASLLITVREIGNKRFEGLTLSNIGKIHADLGERQQALDMYSKALPLLRQSGDKSGEAVTLNNLMVVSRALGNPRLAILYGKQSVNNYQGLRKNLKDLDKETQRHYLASVADVYRRLADLLIEQGNFAQAERVLAMLKDEEFFDFVRRDAAEIAKLDSRVPLNDKEKAVIARYTQLADRVTELGVEFIKLDDKRRLLSRSDLSLSAEEQSRYDDLERDLDTANAAFQLFLAKELTAEIGKDRIKDIDVDRNLQSKLRQWGEGTVALYTIAGIDRYRVVLTTPKTQIDGRSDIKVADLNHKVFEFRKALQNPTVDPRPLGKELYDILLKPIEKDLRAARAKTLVWSLDGTLRYIPLGALSPDGKRYLAEDFQNVVITPKTRDDMSDSNAEWQSLGLGVSEGQSVADPDDTTRSIPFDPLPGTESELKAIVKDDRFPNETGILSGRRFMNKDFTAAAFKEGLTRENADGGRKYNLVHIASHFRLGSNWANSFLLLGGGNVLSLEEINNSSTIDFGGVDLITLSACNTAFADDSNGKEIDSLASVIQTKSGKAVLATLWPVADESTSMLMSEFYRLRKQNPKLTKAAAMQLAQQAMISGKLRSSGKTTPCRSDKIDLGDAPAEFKCDTTAPFAHPYFWAPFVLIGNWR